MGNYCSTCKHVRTAEELGVVSPVTEANELFCGLHPPQTGYQVVRRPAELTIDGNVESPQWDTYDDQPIRLPPCNEGKGYRGMACWTPDDGTVLFALTLAELEALNRLIEWRGELMRAAPSGAMAPIDLGTIVERVQGGLGYLRERAASREGESK